MQQKGTKVLSHTCLHMICASVDILKIWSTNKRWKGCKKVLSTAVKLYGKRNKVKLHTFISQYDCTVNRNAAHVRRLFIVEVHSLSHNTAKRDDEGDRANRDRRFGCCQSGHHNAQLHRVTSPAPLLPSRHNHSGNSYWVKLTGQSAPSWKSSSWFSVILYTVSLMHTLTLTSSVQKYWFKNVNESSVNVYFFITAKQIIPSL